MAPRKTAMDSFDERSARSQRQSDEITVGKDSRLHYAEALERITRSFGRTISVLDVGCGTGRFFHCLRQVGGLLAMDISPHMLAEAQMPVRAGAIDIGHIEFVCADIIEVDISMRKFDLIYSIGVLGEYAPFSPRLCKKLCALLEPGGKLFFTIVDTHSRLTHHDCDRATCTSKVLGKVFSVSPRLVRAYMNRCLGSYYMTEGEIHRCLAEGGVTHCEVTRYRHPPGTGWQGAHYDCIVVSHDVPRQSG